jgi:uncharacterized phage protein (TIGR01671 family)
MREIVFRGKRTDGGEWVYGGIPRYGEEACSPAYIITAGIIPGYFEVIPETAGQYTGLKDSNGVRIFDEDIVEDTFGNTGVIAYSDHFLDWRIVFFKCRPNLLDEYGARVFEWVYPKMMLKIIGNTHDNPELGKEHGYKHFSPEEDEEANHGAEP